MTAARMVTILESERKAEFLALLGQRLGVSAREFYLESRERGTVPSGINELMLLIWGATLQTVGTRESPKRSARDFVLRLKEVAETAGVLKNLEFAITEAVRTIDARAQ